MSSLYSFTQLPMVRQDPWLAPFADALAERSYRYRGMRLLIDEEAGSLAAFSGLHKELGLVRDEGRWGLVVSRVGALGRRVVFDRRLQCLEPGQPPPGPAAGSGLGGLRARRAARAAAWAGL